MEEQGVIGLGALNQPFHGPNDVPFGGLHDGVVLVVCQDDHVLPLVAIALDEEARDVVDVVDTSSQLTVLAEVVDTDEEGLALAGTVGVLEGVPVRGAVTELLGAVWWGVARSGAMGGGRGRAERVAVRVKTRRRRIGRGRWLVGGPLGVAAPLLATVASVAALLVPSMSASVAISGAVLLGRGRSWWRGTVPSSSVARVLLVLAAAAAATVSISSSTSSSVML